MENVATEEFISRTEALKDFESCNAENPNWTPQRVKTLLLRQLAADVAPVVRCKDCIYNIDGLCFCRRPLGSGVAVEPDNFCSWGATE